ERLIASLQRLVGEPPWIRADEYPKYQTILFALKPDLPGGQREQLENMLRSQPEVENLPPVYLAERDQYILILTNEFLVKFREDISPQRINQFNEEHQVEVVEKDQYEENLFALKVTSASQRNALAMANIYHESEITLWATPNFLQEVRKMFKPNDDHFKEQWHLNNTGQDKGTVGEDIDAVAAWNLSMGNENVVIAILDDGVDYNHEDLKANIFKNPAEISGNSIDDDKNSYTDDVRGWDFYDDDNNPLPSTFNKPYNNQALNDIHGTPCAGIAAACTNNKLGVSGIAGNCKILPVKIFGGKTSSDLSTTANLAKAIKYASTLADVLSCSWGTSSSTAVTNAFKYAADKGRGGLGCVIFCASGNNNSSGVNYPAKLSTVIAVGASTNKGVRSSTTKWGSNYGSELDIMAPSSGGTRGIYTTDVSVSKRGFDDLDSKGLYTKDFGGTSASTPLAAGVGALVLSMNPNLSKAKVQEILQNTAKKIDASNANYDKKTGFSNTYGYGKVNAHKALKEAKKQRLEGVDIYVRDHNGDTGDTPTSGGWYASVDIRVDDPTNGFQWVTDFNQLLHENAVSGKLNHVLVQVHNRGKVVANTVTINLYWAYAGTGLPQLPSKFWSEYPSGPSDQTHWHSIGQKTLNNLAAGGAQYDSFDWTAPAVDPKKKNPTHFCLLAIINSSQDLVYVKQRDVGTIVRNDNNITLKNVNVVDTKTAKNFAKQFYIGNPNDELAKMVLRLSAPRALEQGWRISLDRFDFSRPFILEPHEQTLVTMEVDLPMFSQEAEITIIQEQVDPPLVVGGITYQFQPLELSETPQPPLKEQLLNASGFLTMLRVHDAGTAYGPPTDRIDVEVVIKLDTRPGKAFGFQLRNDSNYLTRQGMLDLLRDAFKNNLAVNIDYRIAPGNSNGEIIRVWLSK
ncbi:MAG: S8 family serine peptidase, partial [candidate division Zixibacteria bacterium]|nr:S8 family serine peptidase [candidate division Zixibacteria bacterium]